VDGVFRLVHVPAAVGVDADATLGTQRCAHGSDARRVLILTVRHPGNLASTAGTSAAVTAGMVAFTWIVSRSAGGVGFQPKSMAAASQADASASPYSVKGENSVHPSGPSISMASRTSIPRNREVSGRLTT
jgi:hypothetical protein